MLCDLCQDIFSGLYPDDFRTHHECLEALEKAAGAHCCLCNLILQRFLEELGKQESPRGYQQRQTSWPSASHSAQRIFSQYRVLSISRQGQQPRPRRLTFELVHWSIGEAALCIFLEFKEFKDIQQLLPSRPLSNWTGSQSALLQAGAWLTKCMDGHAECNATKVPPTPRALPSRLLNIGQPRSHMVKLSRPSLTNLSIKYMTLSHCWGSADFIRLTSATAESLSDGIPISDLPQTFQDAIHVARNLGVQLLWIDSLCIFQDSVEDWQQEAAAMGDIYAGSLCNIAATGAQDAHTGCLFSRVPSIIEPLIVTSTWTDAVKQKYHIYEPSAIQKEFAESGLRRRGWIVQELLLAPRILHLHKRQLWWECLEQFACETYSGGLLPGVSSGIRDRAILHNLVSRSRYASWIAPLTGTPLDQAKALWRQIVLDYTECQLSRPSDKLVALSGVAGIMEQILDDKYVAGLWRNFLPAQLLWSSSINATLERASDYRAPSWSWASMDGKILAGKFTTLGVMVNVIEIHLESLKNDPSGHLVSGTLRLSGPLFSIEFRQSYVNASKEVLINRQWGEVYRSDWHFDSTAFHHKLHCLPIQLSDGRYHGLILEPTGGKTGTFRRVGHFLLGENSLPNWSGWQDIKNHQWFEYEHFDGFSSYTITII